MIQTKEYFAALPGNKLDILKRIQLDESQDTYDFLMRIILEEKDYELLYYAGIKLDEFNGSVDEDYLNGPKWILNDKIKSNTLSEMKNYYSAIIDILNEFDYEGND